VGSAAVDSDVEADFVWRPEACLSDVFCDIPELIALFI
jgi:hypothetical protein